MTGCHILQISLVNLAAIDTKDYHLELFQHMIDEIFKDLPNVIGIGDDILVAGYNSDGKDNDETLWWVIQTCRDVNLKLNKDKCHFR